ncbi:MAG TPA: hypothetical protein VKS79_02185 [Gemmataceae bacterium]|nr:hypothetical protein [Gemmataceae bacterium]
MPIQTSCPSCGRALRVPDDLMGKNVKCPSCQTQFVAEAAGGAAAEAPPPLPRESRRDEGVREDAPSRRPAREEEYEEERPSRRPARRDDDYDDDFDDDRPRRRSRRDLAPHRGTMILVFGILSWFVCIGFGIAAWVMGNNDLREMREGRMDREGEGMTNAGRIIGMIHVIVACVFLLLYCVFFIIMGAAGGLKGK